MSQNIQRINTLFIQNDRKPLARQMGVCYTEREKNKKGGTCMTKLYTGFAGDVDDLIFSDGNWSYSER